MEDPDTELRQAPSNRKNPFRPLFKRAMIYLFIIYACWLLTGCAIQRAILFPRSMATAQYPLPANAELLTRKIQQGEVEAWFIPGREVSAEKPGPVVIFAHGNAELIDIWPEELRAYHDMGISVLLPEYRGYGRSAGKPSQKGIGEDYRYFYDMVIQRPDVDADRVILHGRSLGGGVIAQLARDRPSSALILQSAPASISRMAARLLIPWFLVRDKFDTRSVVRQYEQPVLVMHGTRDQVIPPSHAKLLAEVARNPDSRLIYYDIDHNTIPPSDTYWQDTEQFLKDAGVLESEQP